METQLLLLGVDGGGARCRARLCLFTGETLSGGLAGPVNVRLGLEQGLSEVLNATARCFKNAGLAAENHTVVACLALAGACEAETLSELRSYGHPFKTVVCTTDTHAALVGAHGGEDGGVIIIGTGCLGEAILEGKRHRVGGWGFPVSDEGGGAWIGCEAARRTLWALDGCAEWTPLLERIAGRFESDPHEIARWMSGARPGSFATLAPLVLDAAREDDPLGKELVDAAAKHIERLFERLLALGVRRLALIGSLAKSLEPWLSPETRQQLVAPAAGALAGAVLLARLAALKGCHA